MDKRIYSYPSVYAIGHKMIEGIFKGPVIIEEKIDGSQFSMAVVDGELLCRSKGQQLIIDAPEKMFELAVETAKRLSRELIPGWIYRCEYLQKPKHNTVKYNRVPRNNLIVFDIQTGLEEYLSPEQKLIESNRLDLECVPMIESGTVNNLETFNSYLEIESILGGSKVEGVVVKNYAMMTVEKKAAMGKYVSEAFKEVHATEWRKNNPTGKDIAQVLIERYRTEARWMKAIQHLSEAGKIEGSPRDIGSLIKEVPEDVLKECEQEIKEVLFLHYWPQIKRAVTAGLPEWYKQYLAASAFEDTTP